MKYLAYLTIILLILSPGCDQNRYSLHTASDGRIYRIDNKTGEITLIKGNEVIVIGEESDSNVTTTNIYESDLSIPRIWPTDTTVYIPFLWPEGYNTHYIPQLDSLGIHMVTSWRHDYMYYQFHVNPYSESIETARKSLTNKLIVNFRDINGFNIFELGILINDMTRIVDDSGKPISMIKNDRILCSKELYRDFYLMSVGWNF